jgi:hypothetical protein
LLTNESFHWKQPLFARAVPLRISREHLQELFHIAEEQVVLVAVVRVDRLTPARSNTSCTVMSSKGFSCMSATSASPSVPRVCRMRRSSLLPDITAPFVQYRRVTWKYRAIGT